MSISRKKQLTQLIRNKSAELGFDLFGVAPSGVLIENGEVLSHWCESGFNGDLKYLSRDIEKRINPEYLVPGARSVIVTGLNYYSTGKQGGKGVPVLSRYVYGTDYHYVIKTKLNRLLDYIKSIETEASGRTFVDSSPLLEKAWAIKAGLGWQGRHSIIINKNLGSFFFIGIIVLDKELEVDNPFQEDHCGGCRICINACPSGAINENRTIDVRKCIAYLTIESRGPVPADLADKMEGRIYGCDRCQEVCPWNRHAVQHNTPEFEISPELFALTREEWLNLSMERFKMLFSKSAVKRGKFERLIRNIRASNLPV